MIDRTGQTWEFDDGLMILIVRSRPIDPDEHHDTEHDALVLRRLAGSEPEDTKPGCVSVGWWESDARLWVETREKFRERWRVA